jgi:hypothetical protein
MMNRRQRKKIALRHAPRMRNGASGRKDGIYFEDYCCPTCYWDWGWAFAGRNKYKTDCTESNYLGLLKKYWKTSQHDYFKEYDEVAN